VKFEILASSDPHPVSSSAPDCFGFQTVKKTVRQIWGSKDVIVSAGLFCLRSNIVSVQRMQTVVADFQSFAYANTHSLLKYVSDTVRIACMK